MQNPTYEQVCAGNSGHAEAVELIFDEKAVSYSALLDIFWRLHNPTQLNRQGPDVGSQYRSAVFYLDETQRLAAEESKTRERKNHQNPVVTEITAADEFWPAEDYHQSYIKRRRDFSESDQQAMRRALNLAEQAASIGEVPVGAVIYDANGGVVAEAHNSVIRRQECGRTRRNDCFASGRSANR